MLQTPFKNYDEYKELFVAPKNDGGFRRKNGILLSLLKHKPFRDYCKETLGDYGDLSGLRNMTVLLKSCIRVVEYESFKNFDEHRSKSFYTVKIMGKNYFSESYETDGRSGVCVDGDMRGYRYKNMERGGAVFKMKIGKMYRYLIDSCRAAEILPEAVKLWLCEEITRQWEAYVESKVGGVTLHVDKEFANIYDSRDDDRYVVDEDYHRIPCEGHFNSCMQGHGNWRFYRDSVDASAAYLTKGEGDDCVIIARCIIFNKVTREDTGEVIRVAERQYSTDGEESSQRLLIQKLKDGGYIDAYKRTGAGCGDARAFVNLEGEDMSEVKMHIGCSINFGDRMSYQDSFKWLDIDEGIAYNYARQGALILLNNTNSYLEDTRKWSDYHQEYINEDEANYVDTREDYFFETEVVYAHIWNPVRCRFYNERCFHDDCVGIDREYYYAGENAREPEAWGLRVCPKCGELFAKDMSGSYYSEYLEKWYCCIDCAEEEELEFFEKNGYVYAEYNAQWAPAGDVVRVTRERLCIECTQTMLKTTLESLKGVGRDFVYDESSDTWIEACIIRLRECQELAADTCEYII